MDILTGVKGGHKGSKTVVNCLRTKKYIKLITLNEHSAFGIVTLCWAHEFNQSSWGDLTGDYV